LAEQYRLSLVREIESGITERNIELAENGIEDRIAYKQLFNFRYSDGAEMMTVGWVLFQETKRPLVDAARFESFGFVRTGVDCFSIIAPKLTFQEIRELNRHLPATELAAIPVPVSEEFKQQYKDIYRYFPAFTEAEM
jgi:hypothetical protein